MAANLEKLAEDFGRHSEGNNIAKALRGLAGVVRQLGLPESFENSPEIPGVSEEVYLRTREAVEATGYTFFAAIRSVSVDDLLTEDKQREQRGEPRRFGYVNDSPTMRATVPPAMEIAINPTRVRINGSNNLSTASQKAIISEEEAKFKEQLPPEVRSLVSMCMVDPSTLSQLENAYMDETGELLFPNYSVRTDVETVPGRVAYVGRVDPADRRDVDGWRRGYGPHFVFAVSVVVLPRKLVA